ncbi:MAG: cysteine--tRNA ligase [Kineosporiaceae bacterium]
MTPSTFRLHDSRTRQIVPLDPVRPGHVGIYVCGATPQASPHIGHMRAQVVYDVLRRWLEHRGLAVTLVRNVTDVDDKILVKAAEQGREWWAHAYRFEREFTAAYDALRLLPPTYEPRATGHATEMVGYLERLVVAGHAYVVPCDAVDGRPTADVYFDVRSWPHYGELTRQRLADVSPADDTDPQFAGRKRDPRDFALWKAAKADDPPTAAWPTPWGWGRPGWHLECSAMATRYLGAEFDVHGGGIDLRFPHHENELAQSRAAGDPFARVWMHSAWVTTAGEKMSKSLGNVTAVSALLDRVPGVVLRYYLLSAHYRSTMEFSLAALDEAAVAWGRVASFLRRAAERLGTDAVGPRPDEPLGADFVTAMDDDLGVPAGLAVLHAVVRDGNAALAEGDAAAAAGAARAVAAMAGVLGVDPDPAAADLDDRGSTALDALVRADLDTRDKARAERDFATADAIRARLAAAGIVVEDTADGARWSLAGQDG